MNRTQFQSTVPAMRILENEHHYLSGLMNEWHSIVLDIANQRYNAEQLRQQFLTLRQLLVDFKLPLARHTRKEEAHFFPLLGRYIGFEQGPLVSIQHEHEEVMAYLDHFLHHSAGDELTMDQMKAISQDAGEAFEILLVHFVKEETVLFPMTAQVMNSADQQLLFEQLHTLIS